MIGFNLKKQVLATFHPRLVTNQDESEVSGFIAELLQSLYEAEAQLECGRSQLIVEQERLKTDKEQLRKDREAILEEQNRLVKFQSFIIKLANQIEESGHSLSGNDAPLSKRKTASGT